ncbi:hypothetical protein B0T26DRAFT_242683 [Lasiosphaeria miniovina]|uniref:Uncharacterized protein n=1 Tax=Lasiosphaeria miniovina TaxID=1954250 RepID=A0AA40AVT6_9PEZI|nr:uncharacterized protein B0T26DRAFT_242683 [Lasiosphaeria miniovina]KAK0722953.1 hypothetical protein B0T26DRAFT_242683 [Lasiosphaeria miniovina]
MGSRRWNDDVMANSQGLEVAIGQGIELAPTRPQFQEHSVPGMEVVEHSNLEVVTSRQGLSQTKTWEKTSGLPEPHNPYLTGHDYGQQRHHRQDSRQTEPGPGHMGTGPHGTPLTSYSSIAPPYGFNNPYDHQPLVPPSAKGGGGSGGGGAPFSQRERICGLKRQTFWIVLAIVIFLLVVGAAAGVGVGVATSRKSSDTSTSVHNYCYHDGPHKHADTSCAHGLSRHRRLSDHQLPVRQLDALHAAK